ncbi:MAG: GNAT family N-acetyltransferase [Cyclobacteriaceae bacterium]|nr:GNAT family N-acetyltransferase [Cyclobacteriaceae bacterium HetDA_MAG_MS6]
MWPDHDLSYVKLPEDREGQHFGLFHNDELIAVASLFSKGAEAQFRKLATLQQHQSLGFGSMLMKHILDLVANQQIRRIWCNARSDKTRFYEKFGLKKTGHVFEKGGVDFIVMQKYL